MQRKVHKKPDRWVYNKRKETAEWRLYHEFDKTRHGGNIYGGPISNYKMLCISCKKAFKMVDTKEVCMTCGGKLIHIAQRVKLPRKIASDKAWNKFIERFCK